MENKMWNRKQTKAKIKLLKDKGYEVTKINNNDVEVKKGGDVLFKATGCSFGYLVQYEPFLFQ